MLPMAFGTMIVFLVAMTFLITLTALATSTQQQYNQQITTLQDILPKDSLKLYDQRGALLYEAIDQGLQTTVPLSKISPNLIHAEIAIEDQNFWSNSGYDITGIVRAALSDTTNGRVVSGGSTITQQLIKNTIVGNQTTLARKLQEILLAPDITRKYSKQEILSMYLNTIYYGEQAYGADAAAFTSRTCSGMKTGPPGSPWQMPQTPKAAPLSTSQAWSSTTTAKCLAGMW